MTSEDKKDYTNLYVSLREHFEIIEKEREKRYNVIIEEAQKALILAKNANDFRLEELNNLRRSVENDRLLLVRQETYEAKIKEYDFMFKGLNIQNATLTTAIARLETRSTVWMTAIGVFFMVVQIAIRFWK